MGGEVLSQSTEFKAFGPTLLIYILTYFDIIVV